MGARPAASVTATAKEDARRGEGMRPDLQPNGLLHVTFFNESRGGFPRGSCGTGIRGRIVVQVRERRYVVEQVKFENCPGRAATHFLVPAWSTRSSFLSLSKEFSARSRTPAARPRTRFSGTLPRSSTQTTPASTARHFKHLFVHLWRRNPDLSCVAESK